MEKLYTPDQTKTVYGNFYGFATIAEEKTLQDYDRYALNSINAAENLIAALRQYRIDLHKHHQALSDTKSHQELHFVRHKNYSDKKVYYQVKLLTVYENSKLTPRTDFNHGFTGTERKQAKELFEQMKKDRPHVKCFVDLEKKSWEK